MAIQLLKNALTSIIILLHVIAAAARVQDGGVSTVPAAVPVTCGPTQGGGVTHLPRWTQVPGERRAGERTTNHLLELGLVLQSSPAAHIPPSPQPLGLPTQEPATTEGSPFLSCLHASTFLPCILLGKGVSHQFIGHTHAY